MKSNKEILMKSILMRNNPLFTRSQYALCGQLEIPLVKKQSIDVSNIELISCADTKSNDTEINKRKGVHFFVDDYRFNRIYDNPQRTLNRYSQYSFLLTPDYSLYADMPLWKQIANVAKNRWCGAFWQDKGLTVIPTISWGLSNSFSFCFDGVEKGSIVAVSTLGCLKRKSAFLSGYNEMLKRISPTAVICFGKAFEEMEKDTIVINYLECRKGGK
ncbi:MAG TPA: hypothetical protein DD384_02965 [Firmicutes bacterium]|nr:hypothetical protein [Clostridiales bacterium]HBN00183.1 hypothetical protein [Bacillota bacterium]